VPISEPTARLTTILSAHSESLPYNSSIDVLKDCLPRNSLYIASVIAAASDPPTIPGPANTTFSITGLNLAIAPANLKGISLFVAAPPK